MASPPKGKGRAYGPAHSRELLDIYRKKWPIIEDLLYKPKKKKKTTELKKHSIKELNKHQNRKKNNRGVNLNFFKSFATSWKS